MRQDRKIALNFIILLGMVSLFGDITYEGARSVTGPFLLSLGANAAMVGLVAGLGEFMGYALRLLSGFVADRTRAYWPLVFLGYGALLFVPLLAFAGIWQIAAMFIILERMGKAIRTPARDTILSPATKKVGRGWGFGIHEAIDQIGALIGPLLFSFVFFVGGGFNVGFNILWIPAALTLLTLSFAWKKLPCPEKLENSDNENLKDEKTNHDHKVSLPSVFWFYSLFIFLTVAGFANFPLIAYHLKARSLTSDVWIPLLYALAMGVDALVALVIGKVYDKIGLKSLITLPFLTVCITPLAFSLSFSMTLIAIFLWGSVMGIHETIMRAAVADLVPVGRRGSAYGIFNTLYGVSWLIAGAMMGAFYSLSVNYLILFSLLMQAVSLPVFFLLRKKIS